MMDGRQPDVDKDSPAAGSDGALMSMSSSAFAGSPSAFWTTAFMAHLSGAIDLSVDRVASVTAPPAASRGKTIQQSKRMREGVLNRLRDVLPES